VILHSSASNSENLHTSTYSSFGTLNLEADLIIITKANEMHYFSNLFDKVLYMFRICPLSIIRSISTLYTRNKYLSC